MKPLEPMIKDLAEALSNLTGEAQVTRAIELANKALYVRSPTVGLEALEAGARIDVGYEVAQYCTWVVWPTPRLSRTPPVTSRVLTVRLGQIAFEARALHLRNLADFLSKPRPTKPYNLSSLVAAHYFDDGSWSPAKHLYSAVSSTENGRVQSSLNQHLAHITTDRHTSRAKAKPFDWKQVDQKLVLEEFVRFVGDLSQSSHPERARWFKSSRKRVGHTLRVLNSSPSLHVTNRTNG